MDIAAGAAALSSGSSALDALVPALHSQKMVLPANISQMLQSVAVGRGAGAADAGRSPAAEQPGDPIGETMPSSAWLTPLMPEAASRCARCGRATRWLAE
jgi:hypothetical protein